MPSSLLRRIAFCLLAFIGAAALRTGFTPIAAAFRLIPSP